MAYWIHKAGTSTRPNYRFFYMDSDESVSELPTATTDGVKQSVDSSAHNVCSIGSKALSLSTSTIYKLDSNNKWIAQSSSSGSSSGGGQSAYQIAVEYGFEGSVEEWLQSLNGKDGTDGTDGQTPTIGENGNWFLGENDTGKPSRGEKGEKGDSGEKGPAGANGKDGKSAYEIWKEQTGNENKTEEEFLASLKGEKGEKGDPGEKGEKGDPGTTNYNDLTNKPTLNGVTIEGDKTSEDYGIESADRQEMLERSIENYYALRRTGKIYQTKLWKFASNPTPTGEKLLDNAGLVFEPSTDSVAGQDDYLNGQNPLFEWVHCNYIRDADGTARPTAIEGMSNYATTGSVDVGAMQMSFWWKWDTSNADYDLITISDTPHPELGLVPWTECKKADGTVVPWCIGSAYVSGIASDGKLRSQPGLKPERNQSHNSMITDYQEKGEGYWGAGACRNVFQIIFNAIKGNTKNSQNLYAGVTSWNIQYEASIQSADNNTYFPVTNTQAENIPVGCYVSVGYGENNNGTANNDRGKATIHAYADDVKVINKVALDDGANTAIYLDIPEESAFNTQPHVYTDIFSAPIMLSSMHAWSGTTDTVLGHHDGSPVSNTDGKHAYRVQGREYAVGAYIVASDTVMDLQPDSTKKVYVAPKGTTHSSSDATIRSTYEHIGTIPAAEAGNNADWWIGDCGFDVDTGSWYPSAEGSGSSQGYGDRVYAGGAGATSGTREYLQGGLLGDGAGAGSAFLVCWGGLGGGNWHCAACD